MRTRIKICDITSTEAALAAARESQRRCRIGLVFRPEKPAPLREARQAATVCPCAATLILQRMVGLFVDAAPQSIHDVLNRGNLDLLQFHGAETPRYCRAFPKHYVKDDGTHEPDVDLHAEERPFSRSGRFACSTPSVPPLPVTPARKRSTGNRVPQDLKKPVILAGGLTPGNVADAIRRVRPLRRGCLQWC